MQVAESTRSSSAHVVLSNVAMNFHVPNRRVPELTVLEGVSLSIEEGEFCCFIGPSGCGKSTLLRIVAGLISSTGGSVAIGGSEVSVPRREVGVVFQNFNLFPWRTVIKNVELGLESIGVDKEAREERARRWLRLVGLEDFEDYYPSQLSGGMQQRVGIARALAVEPEMLLMDEPFGSVDAQTRRLMQDELMKIWSADRKTVVFVTHDVEEAIFLGDRVIVFSSRPGRILEDVRIPFNRPRGDAVRAHPDFVQLKEFLWDRLKAQVVDDSGVVGDVKEASATELRRRRWLIGRSR